MIQARRAGPYGNQPGGWLGAISQASVASSSDAGIYHPGRMVDGRAYVDDLQCQPYFMNGKLESVTQWCGRLPGAVGWVGGSHCMVTITAWIGTVAGWQRATLLLELGGSGAVDAENNMRAVISCKDLGYHGPQDPMFFNPSAVHYNIPFEQVPFLLERISVTPVVEGSLHIYPDEPPQPSVVQQQGPQSIAQLRHAIDQYARAHPYYKLGSENCQTFSTAMVKLLTGVELQRKNAYLAGVAGMFTDSAAA
eukprot:TRINITY_DN30560_c0_g1_i1.p1 TRINITY_DN30560_c0_g1~~TRINITY_DN30560_c0_g1_i1.p1  ORF type:complete len:251 (+),score=26.68 TRINITY_DN30560_c0_g1_i1:142-894(+)